MKFIKIFRGEKAIYFAANKLEYFEINEERMAISLYGLGDSDLKSRAEFESLKSALLALVEEP